jgi:hypothetical protein
LKQFLQTNADTISATFVRITTVSGQIVAEQAIRALEPGEPIARWCIIRNTNARSIALHAASAWSARIVAASFRFLIAVSHGSATTTRRVFVCELTCASAGVRVFAVVRVGHTGHIFRARCDLESAWPARFGRAAAIALGVDLGTEDGEDGDVSPDRVHLEDCLLVCIPGVFELCCCLSQGNVEGKGDIATVYILFGLEWKGGQM